MTLKVKGRTYNSDDLRKLMYNVSGWAQGWDDVLHAPEDVLSALRQLQEPSYPSVGALLQEVWVQARQGGSLPPGN